jgi:alpha-galactosidase
VFSDVTQSFIERQIDGVSARRLTVGGKKTSLCDLGFCRVGIDSGWAECSGVNGSWHDETGHFIINRTSFPDMKAMVDYGHSKGVLMGFYLNQDLDP